MHISVFRRQGRKTTQWQLRHATLSSGVTAQGGPRDGEDQWNVALQWRQACDRHRWQQRLGAQGYPLHRQAQGHGHQRPARTSPSRGRYHGDACEDRLSCRQVSLTIATAGDRSSVHVQRPEFPQAFDEVISWWREEDNDGHAALHGGNVGGADAFFFHLFYR